VNHCISKTGNQFGEKPHRRSYRASSGWARLSAGLTLFSISLTPVVSAMTQLGDSSGLISQATLDKFFNTALCCWYLPVGKFPLV
jgi:uncharacterized membrane protein YqgA involved in biofilm formation